MNITAPFFSGFTLWIFIKIMILVLLTLYVVFAFVIVRQEQLMSKVVEVGGSILLKTLVLSHFIASVILFFLTLFFL